MNEVIIYGVISVIFISFLFNYLYEDDFETFFFLTVLILVVYFGAAVLPVVMLYTNYIKFNKKTILVLEKDKILVNQKSIYLNEIKKIKIYATHQHFSGHNGVTSLPYNDYFYYIEVITDDAKNILTSLLSYDLDKDLLKEYPSIPIQNVVRAFPIIHM